MTNKKTAVKGTSDVPDDLCFVHHLSLAIFVLSSTLNGCNIRLLTIAHGFFDLIASANRLALFEPDGKRIQQAIAIVEKDKPWRACTPSRRAV
jgi:hypothetical protein